MEASTRPRSFAILLLLLLVLLLACELSARRAVPGGGKREVTYDGRSLFLDGTRMLFFSGSVHYPRSTPEMWTDIILKAKGGGLNMIETYVFWNIHEPVQGKFNFEGRYDLVKFIKLIQKHDMYAMLRIGPFIEAEWNHGGLPYWLREVQNITFRTHNAPFEYHMQKFVEKIVQMMKDEKLFYPQGGPIVLSQIENEYTNVRKAFKEDGTKYVRWAGAMAESLNTGVPWFMCKETNAPGEVISACNGRNCGDTFPRPANPTKPFIWAENWTAQYRSFGDPPSQRATEDIAFSVARFFSKNGTVVNYYMYHGGTNFGRTTSSFVTTQYYDEAPLDEFGLYKEPKYGHLTELHRVLQASSEVLLDGEFSVQTINSNHEIVIYEKKEKNLCVAFLSNGHRRRDATIKFQGKDFYVPRRSISILSDCKTVDFNTQRVNSQHNTRAFDADDKANVHKEWQMHEEFVPKVDQSSIFAKGPLEHFNLTKDTSDYVWFTTRKCITLDALPSFTETVSKEQYRFWLDKDDLPLKGDKRAVMQITSLGHALVAFVNERYVGYGHGKKVEYGFKFGAPVLLREGDNDISLLGATVGLPDSGAYLELRSAGVHTLTIEGLSMGTLDLSYNTWGHEVGLEGEKARIFSEEGAKAMKWNDAKSGIPNVWYKKHFHAPSGKDPVALDLSSMGKGMAWVNGECIGRYWVSFHNALGSPSQSMYHVPRSMLKVKHNLLVLFEEQGGRPQDVQVMTVNRDNICTFVSDVFPGEAMVSRRWENDELRSVAQDARKEAEFKCPKGQVISSIIFASFGNPVGICGNFTRGSCHSPQTQPIVEKMCLGKKKCMLPIKYEAYEADQTCNGTTGTLAVHAKCAFAS